VAVAGGLRGAGDGAKHAFVPALGAHAEVPLERVTGLTSAVERTASFGGAALAGLLVAVVGPANALVVDAISFGICAAVFAWSTTSLRAKPVTERPADTTYARELREGWDFLRRDPVLVAMTAMVAVTNLLDLAYSGVLLPVWVKDGGYGAGLLGAIFATWAASSAVGSVVAAWAAERMPRFHVYVWAFLIAGLPRFLVLALGAPLWLVLATCVLGGFASDPGRRDLRTSPGRCDGPGDHAQQRAVLVADADRRPARRGALRDDRDHRRVARRRVRLPRRHHGSARDPGLPAVRPPAGWAREACDRREGRGVSTRTEPARDG
jgi:hypothetical protein